MCQWMWMCRSEVPNRCSKLRCLTEVSNQMPNRGFKTKPQGSQIEVPKNLCSKGPQKKKKHFLRGREFCLPAAEDEM